MDNLTHTLTGLMMARCGLARERNGAVMMMLAVNAPDIDALVGLPGSLRYLDIHRGYIHSFAAAPLLALLPLLIAHWSLKIRLGWKPYLACLAGVLSHLLLDLTNVYGIRLLLPFSDRWLRLDITDVIDPWIWLILFLALAAPALSRLVGSEIGEKSGSGATTAWAWFALLALLAYDGARFTSHQRALAMMEAHQYGSTVHRISATPARLNPLSWRGIVETDDFVLTARVDVTGDFHPDDGVRYYSASLSPAIEAARRTPIFRVFARFNQMPFWRAQNTAEGTLVELLDLRFGTPVRSGFAASAIISADGTVKTVHLGMGLPR